jgi:hypothetical protein
MRRLKLLLAGVVYLTVWAGIFGLFTWPAVNAQGGVPPVPTGVMASDNSYKNKVGVSWDVIRGATRYQVFRHSSNDAASAVSLGTTVEATFFDRTAVAGQNYFYWVRAENANAASGLSAPDSGSRATGTAEALEPPSAPAGNPVTATKAALGKTLFWDEQLSSTRTVACGTCHVLISGGSDPRSIRPGIVSTHPGPDGVSVMVRDALGAERAAPLFFVSTTQINYLVPTGTTLGEATVTVKQGANSVAGGMLQIATVSPGIFLGEAGIPAASVLRVKSDGTQSNEPVAQFNSGTSHYELLPLDLGPETDQLFLVGYGTDFRNRS